MRPETLLLLLLVLACPLGMMFMMRGGHGAHGRHGAHGTQGGRPEDCDEPAPAKTTSLEELRSQRHALEAEIAERESRDRARPRTPART